MHNTAELEGILKSPLKNVSNNNTITHLAAEGGHVAVFKVRTCTYVLSVHQVLKSIYVLLL